jgi:hypothetical protein
MTPLGPSEAEETAGSAGGDWIAFFFPLVTVAKKRLRERRRKVVAGSHGFETVDEFED